MLADLFAVIAPVFVCAGLGFAWARTGRAYDMDMVSGLVFNFGAPCLIAVTIVRTRLTPEVLGTLGAATTVTIAICGFIGWGLLRLLRWPVAAYLPGLMFANTTNMGLALALFAFGPEGLAMAIPVTVIAGTGTFAIGTAIMTGSLSLGQLLRLPTLYGLVVGLIFQLGDIEPPAWLENSAHTLGNMVIPIMLVTLGVSLARLKFHSLRRSAVLAVVRLALGFGVSVGVAALFGLEGMSRGVLIVLMSMPTAVFNYLLALRFSDTADEVAGMVVASTCLSFLLLPALMWYVR
ncbi:MAG: AEC family transporter [Rhodospirillales bacterium]|jgi:predicted permease